MPDTTIYIKADGTVDLGRLGPDLATEVVRFVSAHVPVGRREAFYDLLMTSIAAKRGRDDA